MGIVGAILGDIAGSPFEFQWDSESLQKRRTIPYELFSEQCKITDDSILSIACMDACLSDKNFAASYRTFGLSYPASYGGQFGTWLYLHQMGPYKSYGNGSAMRVSFVGEHYPMNEVSSMAKASAEVTHNHEEGIKGAVVVATCIRMAEDDATKEDILAYAISQYNTTDNYYPYRYGCDRPYQDYYDDTTMDETCMTAVPIAIRCFYESTSFESCMRMIHCLVCDTDTIGAIAGSICESYYKNCMGSKQADMAILYRYLPSELYAQVAKVRGFLEDGSDVFVNASPSKSQNLPRKKKSKGIPIILQRFLFLFVKKNK